MTGERENFASNRRGFLRHLCALPMIGAALALIGQPTAKAGLEPDPIVAAIEAHRGAWNAFNDAVEQTDGRADREGREMNAAERALYKQASHDEESAWDVLLEHPCGSLHTMHAKATYLLDCPRTKGLSWQEAHVEALLTSLTGGARG